MIAEWVEVARQWPDGWAWLAVIVGSGGEAMLPPIPGDSLVVVGGILAQLRAVPLAAVWVVSTVAGGIGAAGGWLVGQTIRRRGWMHRLTPEVQTAVAQALVTFRRFGSVALVVNRFVPGLRVVAFIAAGVADMPVSRVVSLSTVGAWLWNGALLALAWAFHARVDELDSWLATYQQRAVLIVGAAVLVGWVVVRLRSAR